MNSLDADKPISCDFFATFFAIFNLACQQPLPFLIYARHVIGLISVAMAMSVTSALDNR